MQTLTLDCLIANNIVLCSRGWVQIQGTRCKECYTWYVFGAERVAKINHVPTLTITEAAGNTGGNLYTSDPFVIPLNVGSNLPAPIADYYAYDHLGNTRLVYGALIGCASSVPNYQLRYAGDYYPFGKVVREWSATTSEKYLYTQKERDKETGLDYFGARYYDSELGRFLGVDPMESVFPKWNGYNYAMCSPIRLLDPDGKSAREGVGVNEDGFVVYDDGKKDMNVYYLGKYKGKMLTSKDEATRAGVEMKTFVDKGRWVGTPEEFGSFISTQLELMGQEFATKVIGKYTNDFEFDNLARVDHLDIHENTDKSLVVNYLKSGEFRLNISKSTDILGDLPLLRNTLVHEAYHVKEALKIQGTTETFNSFDNFEKSTHPEEKAAYKYQMKHPSWEQLTRNQQQVIKGKSKYYE